MSDKKTLEHHRRVIANLRPEAVSSGVKKTFDKAAEGQKVKKFKGACSVCGQPLNPGFAVRCEICSTSLFHASCFGTHVMKFHSPASVTVVVIESEAPDTWFFVDADPDRTEPEIATEELPETKTEVVSVPEEEEEEEPVHIAAEEEPKKEGNTRETRAKRTRKRQQISE